MDAQPITFSLIDRSAGVEATPDRVRLQALADFAADVASLLSGTKREVDPTNIDVTLKAGSVSIVTEPISGAPVLLRDLQALLSAEVMSGIDEKRRSVIERWQRLARKSDRLAYKVQAPFLSRALVIDAQSDFRANDADQWVHVERYVRGEIQNIGGATKSNAHIRLEGGDLLAVATDRQRLKDDQLNRLYKPAMLRIRARYNVLTRELRDAELIEFIEYTPQLDEAALDRFTRRGAQAWKDVPDATAWVDELRGEEPAA